MPGASRLGFFMLEEEVDHIGARPEHRSIGTLAGVELARLAQQLAQDFVATVRAVFTSPRPPQVGQASHSRWARDSRVRLRVISTRPSAVKPFTVILVWSRARALRNSAEHGVAVFGALHVDEVDDDDAAQVAHAQLAGDGLGGLEVGLEDGVVEVARADEAAGVHVDGGHRLGLVDDQVAAGLEVDAAGQGLLDLVLDAVQVEQRALAGVVLEQRATWGMYSVGEGRQLLEVLARVDERCAWWRR
jgi:hypothetical protein